MTIRISDFTTETTTIEQQIIDVKAYATENYDRHGWDFVIECYSDEELAEAIGKRKNSRGAINAIYAVVKPQDEARRGARAAGGEFDDDGGERAAIAAECAAEAKAIAEDNAAIEAAAAAKRAIKAAQAKTRRAAKKAAAAA